VTHRSFAAVLALVACAFAQAQAPSRVIFDGRANLSPGKLSSDQQKLLRTAVSAAARKAWHARGKDGLCPADAKPEARDIAAGAFTRSGAAQKAILYSLCTYGHGMALAGVAVVEDGGVAAHIIYESGEDNAIGALADINGNGLAEVLIAGGSTNQGITVSSIAVIELPGGPGGKIASPGRIETLSDNCGASEDDCQAVAKRISVKPANPPAFFKEEFVSAGGKSGTSPWKKSGALSPVLLQRDQVKYELLK
jgi:hypothetical protein